MVCIHNLLASQGERRMVLTSPRLIIFGECLELPIELCTWRNS